MYISLVYFVWFCNRNIQLIHEITVSFNGAIFQAVFYAILLMQMHPGLRFFFSRRSTVAFRSFQLTVTARNMKVSRIILVSLPS